MKFFDEPDLSEAALGLRRAILLSLLFFTATLGIFFEILNYLHGNYPLAAVEFCMTCFACGLMPIVRRTRHLRAWSLLFMLSFNSVMMFALASPMTTASVFSWVLLLPILCQLLLGRRLGTIVMLAYLEIAGTIYYARFGNDAELGNTLALANVACTAICIYAFAFVYESSRARAELALRHQARTDPLTGLGNRTHLAEHFRDEKARHLRSGTPFCLLMLDIDNFKSINDRHGHDTGDAALCWLAEVMQDELGNDGRIFRYGGEEFCVLISQTDGPAARLIAERLRVRFENEAFHINAVVLPMTISIGLADNAVDDNSLTGMISVADSRLYEAKRAGRNRVVG